MGGSAVYVLSISEAFINIYGTKTECVHQQMDLLTQMS